MFSAVIIDKGDFYRLALLFNGKVISFVFGAGSHVESFARLESEASDRNHSAAVFAEMPR